MSTYEIDYEYAVRVRDERNDAPRIDTRPTLAMAQDYRDMIREAYARGSIYFADAEVVMRAEGASDWTALTDEDITRIQQETWDGLDRAMEPVITAGLEQLAEQQARISRP